jgi:hypothetical protein
MDPNPAWRLDWVQDVSAIVPDRPHFIKTFRPWFYLRRDMHRESTLNIEYSPDGKKKKEPFLY